MDLFGDFWYVWVLPFVGGIIWYLITKAAACGAPSSVSPAGDGGKLCQWIATSYHIALLFDANDVCTGITHEVKV